MRTKKAVAFLAVLMLIAAFAGCSNAPSAAATTLAAAQTSEPAPTETTPSDPYAEPVHFTAASLSITDTGDYTSDPVYKFLSDKFNFTYELYPMTFDNWAEKNRLWITSGDMPDWTFWDFNYTEYVSYAEQGLIAAFPDGWEQSYPNLSAMMESTGIKEKINLDGKTYAVPKGLFDLFAPIHKAIYSAILYYRDDWRQNLGMPVLGDMITLDQMDEYLSGCIQNKYAPGGLSSSAGEIVNMFVSMENSGWNSFYKKDGQYVWGPAQPETLEGIKLLKKYYDEGIIDHDFYLNKAEEYRNEFESGQIAMMYSAGSIDNATGRIGTFGKANPDLDAFSVVKIAGLLGPDGKWHGTSGSNFWASTVFNPKMDATTMNRALALFDYLCTEDGQLLINLGIEGVDWQRNTDGSYAILRTPKDDGSYEPLYNVYPSTTFWYILAILPDDFSFVNPTKDKQVASTVIDIYKQKAENGNIMEFDPDYTFFISDAKSAYSVDTASEIVREIMTQGVDIDTEWAAFVKAQEPMYQPVLDDLNAAFGK
jgi:putative aldouronate transport system substrate-binding protein